MNVNDLLKRIDTEEDKHKMFIFRDENGGWTNVNFEVKEHEITVTLDVDQPFDN